MLAYVYDDKLKNELNSQRQNYWEIYIEEILSMIGASAERLSPGDICDFGKLSGIKTLIIGSQSGKNITAEMNKALRDWVKNGGILIGFALKGMDEVFGIEYQSGMQQTPDDYSLSGYIEMRPHILTKEIHTILFKEQKLTIFSDIELVRIQGAAELARLYDTSGNDMKVPAVTWHKYGEGYAGYFAFDVPKTVWLLHQGKPVPRDAGNKIYRNTALLSILGNNSKKIPYADEMAHLIQNMIAQSMQPFIYQIPPEQGEIPDALFYWGGDEYFGPVEMSLFASDWMKEKGLPYHINIGVERSKNKKDGHPITEGEMQHIFDNGHEISLWYFMLCDRDKYDITEEDIKYQTDLFYEKYGYRPVTTLMCSTNWKGWAEPARWMSKYGVKADNTFSAIGLQGDHPLYNASFYGFGSGTSYPFFFYEDFQMENKRLDLIEEPITCYELGHRGSLDISDKETRNKEDLHLPVDMAAKYHFTLNFFYHPYYIYNFPMCREAIEEILRYIDYSKYNIIHMGNDKFCKWWYARSESTSKVTYKSEDHISIAADCRYSSGMIVKLHILEGKVCDVLCDNAPALYQVKKEFCGNWLFIIVPEGEHKIDIKLK